jgi:hypothetical protein
MGVTQTDAQYEKVRQALQTYLGNEVQAQLKGDLGLDVGQQFSAASLSWADIKTAFSRQGIEKAYQTAYDGSTLDVQTLTSLSMQSDVLAGLEKAYRLRHRRRLDYLVGGTARSFGLSGSMGFVGYALARMPLRTQVP